MNALDDMTLRDYFAAEAMHSMFKSAREAFKSDGCWDYGCSTELEVMADDAYKFADAMLKARQE